MSRLAFLTYGELRNPFPHPTSAGFVERAEGVFAAATGFPGHIATAEIVTLRQGAPLEQQDWGAWAPYRAPNFYQGSLEPGGRMNAQTLSLWQSLESVFHYAYSGVHLEALRGRKAWFKPPAWPTYVAWWVADVHIPSWDEACARLEHLHKHGPSPSAFGFKEAYSDEGEPVKLVPTAPTVKGAATLTDPSSETNGSNRASFYKEIL